ncbi:tRNA(Met) cytidine acetyltransferase TmcA [Haladaptatus sp. T7]|uniref:tRNA(Met) cytidine acetyltransferase TmcA n=1 Tax=Haladaptatus sp. T7 TaxID=2029368 RepID=UPI0021A257EC|nr:tRNA(Met) cytidine acetyltransferase TmcA [Haladaptatus sp. T7]GKZ13570.1 tRNA cytosine(34) acetyltransferase TmcA [Haladaptatus sp. T7]
MNVSSLATSLREEARRTNERRLLVLAGNRDEGYELARNVLSAAGIPEKATAQVGPRRIVDCERVSQRRAGELLGTTHEAVVFDAHDELRPNALGRVVGAVDGGGLFVLLTPPLDAWPTRRDDFDATLAVPPFGVEDVTGNFRRRFVSLLRDHRGIAIVNADSETVEDDGLTHPAPRLADTDHEARNHDGAPEHAVLDEFPRAAADACLTDDQLSAVSAFKALRDPNTAVVAEADRGRGKSSAAGIAAACFAAEGDDVLVTARSYRSAREVFVRAAALLDSMDELADTDHDPPTRITANSGGTVRYEKPTDVIERVGPKGQRNERVGPKGQRNSHDGPEGRQRDHADVVFVDEAAALPVRMLERFLRFSRVAFTTTIHGYEGAGRGFSVRFRDRLDESDHDVTDVTLAEPIRYAPGDPIEVWAFRALALDARPAVDPLVTEATPDGTEYLALDADDLLADENLLRETFGLLVLAHYRTEPADLARLLDAPNVAVRALRWNGHVVSVALLAREGDLPADVREHMYDGGRVKGNMLPDVLTTQLRDFDAGIPVGMRIMRIATHHAVRSSGLGSRLLAEIRRECSDLDWLGTGFGATPELLRFWRENGYRTVQLSTTRNDASGEYSALMFDPISPSGNDLYERHARRFAARIASVLSDALADMDPDVVRESLRTTDADVETSLTDWEWRLVAASAYGPGQFDHGPAPFRRLVVKQLVDPADPDALSQRQERLLVRKVLQAHRWPAVADELGFHSAGEAMRALGAAFQPLVDAYGNDAAMEEKRHYSD